MKHLAFFDFTEDPFRLTPDRDFFFPSSNHTSLSEVIRFGLHQGEGFIIILGEVGTGKTMLLRFLMSEMTDQFETAFLISPHLTPKQLLLAILADIGVEKKINNKHSLDYLLTVLNDYLYELSRSEKRLLIVIDEAQNLPEQSLEQLRLLSNFESDKQKWLQILLVGQPELREKIEKPSLRQLLQRVTVMETLNPLSKTEMFQYINFRLNKAGRGDLVLDNKTTRSLWRFTHGVPRLINKLMNRSLLVAYACQSQGFNPKIIKEAAESLNMNRFDKTFWLRRLPWILTATLLVAIIIWVLSSKQFSGF